MLKVQCIPTHRKLLERFKRGLYGIYHQVSDKHVSRYLDEFAARFNTRKLTSNDKLVNFLQ